MKTRISLSVYALTLTAILATSCNRGDDSHVASSALDLSQDGQQAIFKIELDKATAVDTDVQQLQISQASGIYAGLANFVIEPCDGQQNCKVSIGEQAEGGDARTSKIKSGAKVIYAKFDVQKLPSDVLKALKDLGGKSPEEDGRGSGTNTLTASVELLPAGESLGLSYAASPGKESSLIQISGKATLNVK